MSIENDACIQLPIPDDEPAQESPRMSAEHQPTAGSSYLSPPSKQYPEFHSVSLPSFREHGSVPTTGNMSAPSSFVPYPFLMKNPSGDSLKRELIEPTNGTPINEVHSIAAEIAPESSQHSDPESSQEILSGNSSSPGADDEMEASSLLGSSDEPLPSDPVQAPINPPARQEIECCPWCGKYVEPATKYGIYINLLTQVVTIALFLSAIIMGLVYRNKCVYNPTSMYVLMMGCFGLGYFVLRVLAYCCSVFYTPRKSVPLELLAYFSLVACVVVMCIELATLPLTEDHGSCNPFFNYTNFLNITLSVNAFLIFCGYINVLYWIFCKC